jgi:hypothetical protein
MQVKGGRRRLVFLYLNLFLGPMLCCVATGETGFKLLWPTAKPRPSVFPSRHGLLLTSLNRQVNANEVKRRHESVNVSTLGHVNFDTLRYLAVLKVNNTGNVHITLHWGTFMQPLLRWRSNKYYKFWVCVCSPIYPACIAHAPYCHLMPAALYNTFHIINGTILENNVYWTQDLCFDVI